jgi:hypothetical protein
MKRARWVAAVAACVLMGSPCGAGAQVPRAGETVVRLAEGVTLAFSMEGGEHQPRAYLLEDRAIAHDGEIHRLVVDEHNVARFAYALTARSTPEGRAVLQLRPIKRSESFEAFAPKRSPGDTGPFSFVQSIRFDERLTTMAHDQVIGSVVPGDILRMDVFEHPQTGHRIAEVIRVVALSQPGVRRVEAVRAAAGVAAHERPTLRFDGLTIRRNGGLFVQQAVGNSAAGRVLMLGLRGRGTLVFGAEADPDASATGMASVDGPRLRFWLDGEEFDVESSEPIGPDGVVSLWMYFEPGDPTWIGTSPDSASPAASKIWIGAGNDVGTTLRNLRHGRPQP